MPEASDSVMPAPSEDRPHADVSSGLSGCNSIVWLALCALSLFVYLLRSESVDKFLHEVARLVGKI